MDKQGLHIDKTAKCLIYNVQNKYQGFRKPQKLSHDCDFDRYKNQPTPDVYFIDIELY